MTNAHGGLREGSGRPPLPDDEIMKPRSIKVSDRDWKEIKKKAGVAGVSTSEYIRQMALKTPSA